MGTKLRAQAGFSGAGLANLAGGHLDRKAVADRVDSHRDQLDPWQQPHLLMPRCDRGVTQLLLGVEALYGRVSRDRRGRPNLARRNRQPAPPTTRGPPTARGRVAQKGERLSHRLSQKRHETAPTLCSLPHSCAAAALSHTTREKGRRRSNPCRCSPASAAFHEQLHRHLRQEHRDRIQQALPRRKALPRRRSSIATKPAHQTGFSTPIGPCHRPPQPSPTPTLGCPHLATRLQKTQPLLAP